MRDRSPLDFQDKQLNQAELRDSATAEKSIRPIALRRVRKDEGKACETSRFVYPGDLLPGVPDQTPLPDDSYTCTRANGTIACRLPGLNKPFPHTYI